MATITVTPINTPGKKAVAPMALKCPAPADCCGVGKELIGFLTAMNDYGTTGAGATSPGGSQSAGFTIVANMDNGAVVTVTYKAENISDADLAEIGKQLAAATSGPCCKKAAKP
jgi:hypothetical protein